MVRTISVRLDEEAARALERLRGDSRASESDIVRRTLIGAAGAGESLEEEAARIAADPRDRREVAEIQKLMDELSEPW